LAFGGEDPEEFVARFQETAENLEEMEFKYAEAMKQLNSERVTTFDLY